jgi:hypothetical protein
MRECLHVELIEGLFDLVEGAEIAGYHPLQQCREKRGRVEEPDLALAFGNAAKVVERSNVGAVSSQDPVGTKKTVDDDPLTSGVAFCLGDGNGRHPQVALVLLNPWFPLRIAEPQPPGITQIERVEDLGRLVLGGSIRSSQRI